MVEATQATLASSEQKIIKLIEHVDSNWKVIAQTALIVQDQELYKEAEIRSFTQWIKVLASKCGKSESMLWRYIRAGKKYLKLIESEDIKDIEQIKAPVDAIDALKKIEKLAPPAIYEEAKTQVLNGELTVPAAKKIIQEYRPSISQIAEQPQDIPEEEQVEAIMTSQIAPAIKRSLRSCCQNWTKYCAEKKYPPKFINVHEEVRVYHGQRLRLDHLTVVRWSYKLPKDIFVIEIKSCLNDYNNDFKWEEYLGFCNYFCFAIPAADEELKTKILEETEVGLITVDLNEYPTKSFSFPVTVVRSPTREEGDLVSSVYETLYERIMNWEDKSQKKSQE